MDLQLDGPHRLLMTANLMHMILSYIYDKPRELLAFQLVHRVFYERVIPIIMTMDRPRRVINRDNYDPAYYFGFLTQQRIMDNHWLAGDHAHIAQLRRHGRAPHMLLRERADRINDPVLQLRLREIIQLFN